MPRRITASTSGWAQTRSSTSGTVSRVSPPARSIGLLRLQRAGTQRVDRGAQLRRAAPRSSRPAAAQASAVSTPQPPAVVNDHDAPAAREGLRRERRGPFEGLLDGRRAQHAELAADAVEDAVVGRERARVARRRALALAARRRPSAAPAASRAVRRAHRGEEAARRRATPSRYAERDGGLRVGGEVLEVVGERASAPSCRSEIALLTPTPVSTA